MNRTDQRTSFVLLVEDHGPTRTKLAGRLRKSGFGTTAVSSYDEALAAFKAGFFDAVVADWDLNKDDSKKGDALFEEIRHRDWEVPLVLISGKLTEDAKRARTLEKVLALGPVRFVERGQGYEKIVAALRELLARRDLVTRRVIERLRAVQGRGEAVRTTSGSLSAEQILASLLSDQTWRQKGLSPLAEDFAVWEQRRRRRHRS